MAVPTGVYEALVYDMICQDKYSRARSYAMWQGPHNPSDDPTSLTRQNSA